MKKILIFAFLFFINVAWGQSEDFEFFKNSELANKSIVFVSHKQYASSHHNTETMFQKGEYNEGRWKLCNGNSSLVLANFDENGAVKSVEVPIFLKNGIVRDPSVSYDGKKIVFSMRKNFDDSFKLYEYDIETKKIRQLTFLDDVSDINPTYLPDGGIVFSSTRAAKFCACNRHIMCNLYKCDANGKNIIQIGNSIEFENGASVMSDGRILYTRWEYVDRNFSGAQGLWTCNPDGTRHALYWGQETNNAALDGIEISAGKVVAILAACHDKPWGALALIDRNIDVEGKHSVVKIFPKEAIDLVDAPHPWSDAMKSLKIKYQYPSLFGGDLIAVSRQISEKNKLLALYLVNIKNGEHKLVVKSKKGLSLFNFKVIEPRKVPAEIPSQCDLSSDSATIYVSDVYEGTHMKGVKKGDIKFLRVIENPPKLMWTHGAWSAQGEQAPALNYHDFDNKIIYGVVPVEEDGSAYFKVPSGKFIYLQVLDKDMKMLQTMRSGLSAMPSEIVSCAGCHENRKSPPPASLKASMALRKKPAEIQAFPHCGKLFSYMEQIQPIWDKHCMPCHDIGGKGAKKLVLAGDKGLVFNRSYMELWSKKKINAIGAAGNAVVQANTWGAKHSEVIKKIEAKHNGVKLSKDEFDTLVAWIDLNAPYYPIDDTHFGNNPSGRSPLTTAECAELEKLCGLNFLARSWKDKSPVPTIMLGGYSTELVSLDRPETSPILSKFAKGSSEYNRVLELIKIGAERLMENPRPDMKGFKTSAKAKQLNERFENMRKFDSKARKASETNKTLRDPNSL